MRCQITINPPIGIISSGSTTSLIDITGTASECSSILVILKCKDGNEFRQTATVSPDDGTWTLRFVNTTCDCDQEMQIDATCEADPLCTATFRGVLICSEPTPNTHCPVVATPTVSIAGECDPGGTRRVRLVTTVTPSGAGTVVAQWDYGHGASFSPSGVSLGGPIPVLGEHDYPPGHYEARLRIASPTGCPDVPVVFDVPSCPPTGCTVLNGIGLDISPICNSNGTRTVRLTAVVSGSPATNYIWQFGDGSAPYIIDARGGLTAETTHDFQAPGTGTTTYYVTFVAANADPRCSAPSRPIPVMIRGCGTSCPEISGELPLPIAGECTDATHRRMTLDAMISGSGITDFEWDFGDGTSVHPSERPRVDHTYTAGRSYTARLMVRGPTGCPDSIKEIFFSVEACPVPPPTPPASMTSPSPCLCWILLFFAVTFEVAAVILGIAAVLTSNFYLALFGLGALITALILVIIWMAVCRDCPASLIVVSVVAVVFLLFAVFGAFIFGLHGPIPPAKACGLAAVTLLIFLVALLIGRRQLGCSP